MRGEGWETGSQEEDMDVGRKTIVPNTSLGGSLQRG